MKAGKLMALTCVLLAGAAPEAGDAEKLAGAWKVVKQEPEARPGSALDAVVFRGTTMTLYQAAARGTGTTEMTFQLDATPDPKGIDFTATTGPGKGSTYRGIYRLERNRLTICYHGPGNARPGAFTSEGGKAVLLELVRGAR